MAVKKFNTRIQLKRDSSTNFASFTPLAGELLVVTDKNNVKIGDGTTGFGSLPYLVGGAVLASYTAPTSATTGAVAATDTLDQALAKLQKSINDAAAGGVLSIDSCTGAVTLGNGLESTQQANGAVSVKTAGYITAGSAGVEIDSSKIDDDYTAANGTALATVATVAAALGTLTGTLNGAPGAGRTITAFDEVNGKVSATFSDISILSSQISDLASRAVTSVKGDSTYLEPTTASVGDVTISHKTITQGSSTSTGTVGSRNTGTTDTFTVPTVTVDGAGHVTSTDTKTITVTFPSAADLGLSGAMHFVGTSTTDPTSTGGPTVAGHATWAAGDVVLYNAKEYVYDGARWVEFGDEGSYALKTITITAGACLTGGGTLEGNRTIDHDVITTPSSGTDTAKRQGDSVTVMTGIIGDGYGHVTGYTTNTFTIPTLPTVNDATLTVAGAASGPITVAGSAGTATFTANDADDNTITITHAAKPTTLSPVAVKVAVDDYGHAQIGNALTSDDIATVTGNPGHGTSTTVSDSLQALNTELGSHTHHISDLTEDPAISTGDNTIIFDCGTATTCTNDVSNS